MPASSTLLPFQEPAARVHEPGASAPLLLLCDHASNDIPAVYKGLSLGEAELASHIAYDPGAAAVTTAMAQSLDAASVLGGYSRLLIDVNRDPDAPDSIVRENDGILVHGNADISEEERRARIEAIHAPYHAAIDRLLDERIARQGTQLLISVHSFTPEIRGRRRPWDIGLIFNRDLRLTRALVGQLVGAGEGSRLTVGLNEPYSPADRVYYTVQRHAEARGLPCAMIEIANDQLATANERGRWADCLSAALAAALPEFADPGAPGGTSV